MCKEIKDHPNYKYFCLQCGNGYKLDKFNVLDYYTINEICLKCERKNSKKESETLTRKLPKKTIYKDGFKIDGRKTKPNQPKEKIYSRQRLYVRNKLKNDINFRITNILRSRVTNALKGKNKSASTMELIGTDIANFKKHLSSKFKPGMSFNNYGEWEIDHIKPCSWFDLTDPKQQKQCFNFSNTQPLWRFENRSKNNRHCN